MPDPTPNVPRGILVCGLNGAGKSTLARALATSLGYRFLDAEHLTFPESTAAAPIPRAQAEHRLRTELRACDGFVFASVKGDWGDTLLERLMLAVLVETPRDLRLTRVQSRSREKFGDRMRPGGDLERREEAFLRMVAARPEDEVEAWLPALRCPVLRVDGTQPPEANVRLIQSRLRGLCPTESEATP